jgi:hypothetical protein
LDGELCSEKADRFERLIAPPMRNQPSWTYM